MVPRALLIAGVLVASAVFIAGQLQGVDRQAMWQALAGLSGGQVSGCVVAVALAFLAVAGQERAVAAHLALPPGPGANTAAAAAAAVSQTVGFGPVIGAIVRRRLRPGLTMGQSFGISAGITLGFFAGLGLLVLASVGVAPQMPYRVAALSGLAVCLGLLVAGALTGAGGPRGLRMPNLIVLGRFMFWLALDLLALAVALWVLLPRGQGPDLMHLVPVFLIGLGFGVASGSPGGVGPFEATLLAWLPQVDAAGLVAAIIAFRALAYALPALCGALWAVAGRRGPADHGAAPALVEHRVLMAEGVGLLPSAELQVVRQGALSLVADDRGWLWASGALAHTRVMLGAVPGMTRGRATAALAAARGRARSEARVLCLYKIDGRMAAVARRHGHAVLPIAREAVLDPVSFTQSGPDRARLRRKLAHARKAGVAVSDVTTLPVIEMEAVVADWAMVHGRERGFSMGRWDAAYVAGQRVIAARSASGVLLAFITLHEGKDDWVLDLVRFRPGTPDGTTYAMVCLALDLARAAGIRRLSLAAVPVPGFGLTGPIAPWARRATAGSIGLAQFKSAFAPRWEARYVAAPSRHALLIAGLEIARAILRPGKLHPKRAWLVLHQGGGGARGGGMATERAA